MLQEVIKTTLFIKLSMTRNEMFSTQMVYYFEIWSALEYNATDIGMDQV